MTQRRERLGAVRREVAARPSRRTSRSSPGLPARRRRPRAARRSSATGRPSASPTNSAVTRARDSGEATMVAMPRLRSFSAAARACAMPVAFSGISTLPCEMPWAFQSVSPCRRNQNGTGFERVRLERPVHLRPGLPAAARAAPRAAPSCGRDAPRSSAAASCSCRSAPRTRHRTAPLSAMENVAGQVVLAGQRLVHHGEALLDDLLAALLHLVLVGRVRRVVGRRGTAARSPACASWRPRSPMPPARAPGRRHRPAAASCPGLVRASQ